MLTTDLALRMLNALKVVGRSLALARAKCVCLARDITARFARTWILTNTVFIGLASHKGQRYRGGCGGYGCSCVCGGGFSDGRRRCLLALPIRQHKP